MQRLLGKARWDPRGMRDDLREYVFEELGDHSGVLIVDESGFIKKGTGSACRDPGPATRSGARRPEFPGTPSSRPSPRWR
jgi:hypothetical protein